MKFAGKHIAMSVGALLGMIAVQRAYSVLYASPRDALNTKISRQKVRAKRPGHAQYLLRVRVKKK